MKTCYDWWYPYLAVRQFDSVNMLRQQALVRGEITFNWDFKNHIKLRAPYRVKSLLHNTILHLKDWCYATSRKLSKITESSLIDEERWRTVCCWHEWFFLVWTRGSEKRSVVTQCSASFFDLVWIISRYIPRQGKEMKRYHGCFTTTVATTCLLISCGQTDAVQDLFKDCTRELYDRVVRFEYLYYEGYWMYPYNKLRNHGPSYHYTEKNFCKFHGFAAVSAQALSLSKLVQWLPIQMRAFHSNENGLFCTYLLSVAPLFWW